MIYDCIVIGSGAAGVWAAHGLKGLKTLILDVGNESLFKYPGQTLDEITNSPELRKKFILGDQFQTLHNIFYDYLSPKLKAPQMRFVIDHPSSERIHSDQFLAIQSFSKGGLANAWGAGAFKMNPQELAQFPFPYRDIEAAYNTVIEEIGVSGTNDDLNDFLGSAEYHLKPLPLPTILQDLKSRYSKKKNFFGKRGLFLGEGRMAYLSENHKGRRAYQQKGTDFFFSGNESIYSPAITLDKMIASNEVEYKNQILALNFLEESDSIVVHAKNLRSNQPEQFRAKKLILAMGALNTTKFVLKSFGDYTTTRPVLDNNITYVPFVDIKSVGKKWSTEHLLGAPLVAVHQKNKNESPVQMTIYPVGSVLCSDLLGYFPLDLKSSLGAGKFLIPAMIAVQLFYPDQPTSSNYLQLQESGHLKIQYERKPFGKVEREVIRMFRSLGLMSAPFLIQAPQPGNSFHYAGMLPMKLSPQGKYETTPEGRLNGTKNVFIADAANFPTLPAKNHTLTIMANALRIGQNIRTHFNTNSEGRG